MIKAFCSGCNRIKSIHYTIIVNDVPHHFCEQCQQSQKAQFLGKLAAGDPDATRIMNTVLNILKRDPKTRDFVDTEE